MSEQRAGRPRIVVGVDGSDSSKSALRWARRIAAAESAAIEVLGVWAWPNVMGAVTTPLEYSPRDDIEKELTAAVDEVFGPVVRPTSRCGRSRVARRMCSSRRATAR
jgi:nucleotide-binding universal stress UspA family protein